MGRSKQMVVQYATFLEQPEANTCSRNKEKSDQATKIKLLTRPSNFFCPLSAPGPTKIGNQQNLWCKTAS